MFSLAFFTYESQRKVIDQQMKTEAEGVLDKLESDFNSYSGTLEIVKESLKKDYLDLAKAVREILRGRDSYTVEELATLAERINVSEIDVMNEKGILQFSSNSEVIGYNYDSNEQSRPYLKGITDKNFELAQEPAVRGADGKMFMYVGVARQEKPGMFQIGKEPKEYQSLVDSFNLQDEISSNTFAATGITFIANSQGEVIAHPKKEYIGKMVTALPFGPAITDKKEGSFQYEEQDKTKYLTFQRTSNGSLLMSSVEVEDYFAPLHQLMLKFILVGVLLVFLSAFMIMMLGRRNITKPVDELKGAMKEIASGNLTVPVASHRKDEIGEMFDHLNQTRDGLRELISRISTSSETISASALQLTASAEQTGQAAEHISSTIQELASGSESQSNSVEQTTQIVNEMSLGVQQISDNATSVSINANDTSEKASIGNEAIQKSIEQMNAIQMTVSSLSNEVKVLGDQSNQIGNIIQTITAISRQTNLLALNAAIEAARAGEYGEGFAVVANEVRKLAEQSSASAEQITELVSANKHQTEAAVKSMEKTTHEVVDGIKLVNKAGQSFKEIQRATDDVKRQTEEVASAIQHISDNAEMIVASIHTIAEAALHSASGTQNMSASTQEQLAALEEVSASASSLSDTAEELQYLIKNFKL